MRGGQPVNIIYIHSAEQMLVADDICVSLAVFNVNNLTYSGIPKTCNPNQHFSFKLVDSTANLVPSYISQLDMQRSTTKEVIIDRELKSFSVISSDIGHLKVSKPVMALNINVEHSVIDNLEKLHLEDKSQLVLYNVTINKMAKSSLYLQESFINIWAGNIKASVAQAIILGPKASLTLKDTDGRVSLAGLQELPPVPAAAAAAPTQTERLPPGVPPPPHQLTRGTPSCNQSVLLWVFPTVLAAVEAIIIIINCTNWFPSLKGRRVPHSLEEGGHSVTRHTGDAGNYSNSKWYYNTEVPLIAINRRHNTEYDKYK